MNNNLAPAVFAAAGTMLGAVGMEIFRVAVPAAGAAARLVNMGAVAMLAFVATLIYLRRGP